MVTREDKRHVLVWLSERTKASLESCYAAYDNTTVILKELPTQYVTRIKLSSVYRNCPHFSKILKDVYPSMRLNGYLMTDLNDNRLSMSWSPVKDDEGNTSYSLRLYVLPYIQYYDKELVDIQLASNKNDYEKRFTFNDYYFGIIFIAKLLRQFQLSVNFESYTEFKEKLKYIGSKELEVVDDLIKSNKLDALYNINSLAEIRSSIRKSKVLSKLQDSFVDEYNSSNDDLREYRPKFNIIYNPSTNREEHEYIELFEVSFPSNEIAKKKFPLDYDKRKSDSFIQIDNNLYTTMDEFYKGGRTFTKFVPSIAIGDFVNGDLGVRIS